MNLQAIPGDLQSPTGFRWARSRGQSRDRMLVIGFSDASPSRPLLRIPSREWHRTYFVYLFFFGGVPFSFPQILILRLYGGGPRCQPTFAAAHAAPERFGQEASTGRCVHVVRVARIGRREKRDETKITTEGGGHRPVAHLYFFLPSRKMPLIQQALADCLDHLFPFSAYPGAMVVPNYHCTRKWETCTGT